MLISQNNSEKVTRTVGSLIVVASLTIISPDAMAQVGVTGSVRNLAEIIHKAGNIIFVILMIVGLIRTVSGFISNSPNAARNLLMLIVGAVIWYGFNTIVEDIASSVGSDQNGGFGLGGN